MTAQLVRNKFTAAVLAACLLAIGGSSFLQAGTLELAVVQLNGIVESADINRALANESLSKAAWGDRIEVRDKLLRGAPVLFSQSLPVNRGGPFASSTRIGSQRAQVEGRMTNSELSATITLSEGMRAGLRRFSQSVYRGNAALESGAPRVLGIRQIELREPSTTKGKTKFTTSQMTVAVLYQFRP